MSIAKTMKMTMFSGIRIMVILGLVYLSHLFWLPILVPFLEDKLLYLSDTRQQAVLTPDILQGPMLNHIRPVQFPTRMLYQGRLLALNGLYSPALPGKPTIILSNGNGGSLRDISVFRPLMADGTGFVMYEYPGYGKTPGKPSEAALYHSLAAVRAYLRGQGVPDNRQILYGLSLGGAVTVESAARREPKAVILQSTMTWFPDVVRSVMGKEFCDFLPLDRAALSQFNSIGKIKGLRSPLLILHGDADAMMPKSFADRLAEAASQAKPRQKVIVQGGHNLAFSKVYPAIESFLSAL